MSLWYYWTVLIVSANEKEKGSSPVQPSHPIRESLYSGQQRLHPQCAAYTGCQGHHVRDVCVFGVGDLHWLVQQHHLFANKLEMDNDAMAVLCLEKSLRLRALAMIDWRLIQWVSTIRNLPNITYLILCTHLHSFIDGWMDGCILFIRWHYAWRHYRLLLTELPDRTRCNNHKWIRGN